ncbi:glycosyltransferase family 1 protein [Alkalicoccus daliensis]|uniref:Glycosyltransferase involved in cell wall bisynthesis n=1 Tax=Alkalicoccus daliensis TaxID=745820 RepID=A0A1G9ZLH1_9BACI|nr:glycosyltransferase family 1 protein [Alkalicoccus daliensis]SDN21957.1 Glycosyltransferase involved in cell wall bisynthesis [Alkalicoccus daliensis]
MGSIRVLQVTGAMNIGGTEAMLMNLYRSIDRRIIQFDFLTFSKMNGYFDDEIKSLGGRIVYAGNSTSFKELYKLMKKENYHAVHAHTLFHSGVVMAAAKAAGVKIRISHAHTTKDDNFTLKRKLYILMMRKFINQYSSFFLTCSKEAGVFLYGHTNAEWLPNIIQTEKFLAKESAEVMKFKKDNGLQNKLVIGHVGRLMEAKNHEFLLDLLIEMRTEKLEAVLLLVGEGHLRKQLEVKGAQLGLTEYIIFTGALKDPSTALHAMDVFVFPSTYEGLGLVLLEAQAAGVPCITSEFIQPEADAGLKLVKQLSLQQSKKEWIVEIKKAALQGKHKGTDLRRRKIMEKGYDTQKITARMSELYLLEKGGET